MNAHRKQIILKEILYWKENNMLPEQYCNFLLALYTEGEQNENVTVRKSRNMQLSSSLLLLLIPLLLFVLYFTEWSFVLQMVLASVCMICGIALAYFFRKKAIVLQIAIITSAFIFLLATVKASLYFYPGNIMSLYGVLFGNCLIWFLSGWKLKLTHFLVSGVLGLALLIVSLFI